MIDPAKAQAAALSLFDASYQNVREIISKPEIINPDWSVLNKTVDDMAAAARYVVRTNDRIKELEKLTEK